MGRPTSFEESVVISVRMEKKQYAMLQEIACLESTYGRKVTALDLIRCACSFCYEDGERLREVFRRTREHINRKMPRC